MSDEGGPCELPGCTGRLVPRFGKYGLFWGCSQWHEGGGSSACKFTRRPRKVDKGRAVVVLEAESVSEFRLYLRSPPSAQTGRKRKREPIGSSRTGGRGTQRGRVDQEKSAQCALTLQDVIAVLDRRPQRLDTRTDGLLGAVYALEDYEVVHHQLTAALTSGEHAAVIMPVPLPTLEALRVSATAQRSGDERGKSSTAGCDGEGWGKALSKLPPHLRACLLPFQLEGVQFVVAQKGRALLADDMGLGKTLQALASAEALAGELRRATYPPPPPPQSHKLSPRSVRGSGVGHLRA
jgi:hypothetical protein